jgi:tyrosine-specific transport protein
MFLRQLGSIYLILGTCIAAGMLALPIVTAHLQLSTTIGLIITAWFLMTTGAWCLLRVNLLFKPGTNLLTMSERTLGKSFRKLTWFVYVFLLYSLICAYIAGCGDLLQALLSAVHITIPRYLATVIATLALALIVAKGIGAVDVANRVLMSIKLAICLLLIFAVTPHVDVTQLQLGSSAFDGSAFLVIITSFGYAIILPSIRVYLDSNKKRLYRVLFIGSLLPVVLYLAWVIVIQGAIAKFGAHGLMAMNNSPNTNSLLLSSLVAVTHHPMLKTFAVVFISICSVTGLLGVSVCMVDFLSDGLNVVKQGRGLLMLIVGTFLLPMLVVIFRPDVFVKALAYAGIACIYVLILLPILMFIKTELTARKSST